MESYDVLVVGGGIAGVSIGFELAADRRVLVVDTEPTFGYHTTGRSAAMFLETYGGPAVRALTKASRAYFESPPDTQLLSPLAILYVAQPGRGGAITALYRDVRPLVPDVVLVDAEEAAALQPVLRPECVELALLDEGAMEIDVHALHQGYLRSLRARGGQTVTHAGIVSATRADGRWTVTTTSGQSFAASIVVDAAGAWADRVAEVFGAAPVGVQPLRRTAFTADAPPGLRPPMVADIDDAFYFKPDSGRLLCSPADETPQDPSDARPDELEIARALDAINAATMLELRHVRSAWAGLRTFVADRTPVVGFDSRAEGFFWFAAQGGYGIQIAPALARTGAALLRGEPVPSDVASCGLAAGALDPKRLAMGSDPSTS